MYMYLHTTWIHPLYTGVFLHIYIYYTYIYILYIYIYIHITESSWGGFSSVSCWRPVSSQCRWARQAVRAFLAKKKERDSGPHSTWRAAM